MSVEPNTAKLASVLISPERLLELDGTQVVKCVERSTIESMSLKHGICSERTVAQTILSIVIIILGFHFGFVPTCEIAFDFLSDEGVKIGRSGAKGLAFTLFATFFIPFGISLFLDAFKKGYYILVKTASSKRKLVFNGDVAYGKIKLFVEEVTRKYQYEIDLECEKTKDVTRSNR